jgi:hypothetical protein
MASVSGTVFRYDSVERIVSAVVTKNIHAILIGHEPIPGWASYQGMVNS